jgi:hypothetical protein
LLNPGSYTNLNVSGVLSLAAGAVGTPSLAASGDLNTGLWFPAADTIAASVGGVEGWRLTSVGLGLSQGNAPTQVLNIYRSGSTQTVMAAGNSNTGVNGTLFGVDTAGNAIINQTQNFATIFSTNNTERARVSPDGNFVFGTAALATTATAGFPWIPSCAGAPTGAPTAPYTNAAAMVADTTNNRLYVRVGATWRYATLI